MFVDDDGYLTFVGRSDDVFKSSDYRISPFELESVLLEHERSRKPPWCRARIRSGSRSPRPMCCWSRARSARRDTALSIFEHLQTRLAPFKRIRRLELVTELPKTISGKIRRVQLRRLEHDDNRDDAVARTGIPRRGFSGAAENAAVET